MRIAICCFYEAYPPISGAAAVSFNIAKFLPGQRLLVQAGARSGADEIQGVRVITICGASRSRVGRIASLSRRIRAMVSELVRFAPDIVMLEGASWAVYHWMLLRAIRRALPRVRVVYHSHNVEYVLRRQRNGRAVAAITRWAEGRLLLGCDLGTAVSEVDRDLFREFYGADTLLLPNGVDVSRLASVTAEEIGRARSKYAIGDQAVVFSGLYAYPPNHTAAEFLMNEVLPALRMDVPNVQLLITGGDVPRRERWLITPGIVPHEELPALLASCSVAAAPIFFGSGTRLKILEAMAAGIPVVATSKAAEGLPLRDQEHLLIANDAAAFVACLSKVMVQPGSHDGLVSSAREAVRKHFDWCAITPRLTNHLRAESTGVVDRLSLRP